MDKNTSRPEIPTGFAAEAGTGPESAMIERGILSREGFELHRPRSGTILSIARESGIADPASLDRIAATDVHNASTWREHGYGVWLLIDSSTGLSVGCCGLRPGDTPLHPELMYALTASARGKGFACRAAQAAIECAFGIAAVQSVWACTDEGHSASIAVMERAGMSFERRDTVYGAMRVIYRIWRPTQPTSS
jgi:RimJ/RimL family protein N-acetyltransferase